ncbi:hypothetical protein M9H77_07900 [Catharanthus roseus]|uniref:Uncharacterized protein n=1 Tax=Catharanthus roseus TaxID=4058 RepID=A0ACC0BWF3_CATRO|nr:hypothetical protein M9H77_07900 [Catharanthus roseus]
MKSMDEVQRSQLASFQNMENQIELLAKIIVERPLSNIPSNMVTLHNVEEQVMKFPMFMDDEDETAQEPEESTFSRFQEPLPNTGVVEESKKGECLSGNKNEFEDGDPEKENENFVESHESHKEGQQETEIDDIENSDGVNLLTHKINFVLVDNSLCMQESWKQPKENDEEKRRLMEFKENFEKVK